MGSRHNRGCAVDVGLYRLRTGKEVPMPSSFDEMSERAAANFSGGTPEERRTRALLREALEKEGFSVNPDEWAGERGIDYVSAIRRYSTRWPRGPRRRTVQKQRIPS